MEEEPTPSAPIPGLKTTLTLQSRSRRQARQPRPHSDAATGSAMEDQTPSAPFDGIKLILTPQGILRRQAGLPLPASVAATGSDIRDEPTTAVEENDSVNNASTRQDWPFALHIYWILLVLLVAGAGTALFRRVEHQSAAVRDVQRSPDSIVTPVITVSPIHVFEKSAYTSTLDEHTLVAMERIWSNISLILMDLSDPLMSHLTEAVLSFTQYTQQHQKTKTSFLDNATVIESRLGDVSSNIQTLTDHYRRHQLHFYSKVLEAAEALEAAEPRAYQKRLVAGQMEVWARIGVNFTKRYWDPWVEAHRRSEAARSGLATFEGETLKLESIAQGVWDIKHHLTRLSLAVSRDDCRDCVVEKRDALVESWRRLFDLGRDQGSMGS